MSKAEDLAKKYCEGSSFEDACMERPAYIAGYHQAEKYLELTIEDIERIHTFLYAIKHNKQGVFTFTRLSDEQYQKILKRYKDYKERKEKCQ